MKSIQASSLHSEPSFSSTATAGRPTSAGKIQALQGLRTVAFFAIFLSHSRIGQLGCLGAWGVSVFFVLSGFLMLYSYYPREETPAFGLRFAWRKIRTLYPLHLITMLFAAAYAVLTGISVKKPAWTCFCTVRCCRSGFPMRPGTQRSTVQPGISASVCFSISAFR